MTNTWTRAFKYLAFFALFLATTQYAEAQESVARIDQVSDSFRSAVIDIGDKLSVIARNLMLSLLLVELIWKLGKTVKEGDDFGQLMGIFFTRIVIAGFFLAIVDGIPTGSGQVGIATFVIQSAEALVGVTTDSVSIKPSDLFWQMFSSGRSIWSNSSGIAGGISATIVWVLLSVLGAVIVGLMIVTYIEIYVIFTVGILALGFGVWSVTQQFATNFLFSAVGKILKLFTMILMASVISLSIQSFGTLTTFEDGLITIGIVIIFAMLMSSVPQAVEQIISGIPGVSGDSAVSSAISGPAKGAASIAGRGTARATIGTLKMGAKAAGLTKANVSKATGAIADRIRNIKKG